MNFNDGSSSNSLDNAKTPARAGNLDNEKDPNETALGHDAMDLAKKAQNRQHANEQTNSSNTIFSK